MDVPRRQLTNCERFFLGIKSKNEKVVRYRVFAARCHSWDCANCAAEKGRIYRERMQPLFRSRELYLYTFTFYHSSPASEVWREVGKKWNVFRTAATKRWGQFSYARVLEPHNNSPYPHLHVIADRLFPAAWLGFELKKAGFGYQTKCSPVTSKGAAAYVSKYLTKPWPNAVCRTLRKTYKLRVITFGGQACSPPMATQPWELLAKSVLCEDIIDSIQTDRTWTHRTKDEPSFHSVRDATEEWTYVITEGECDESDAFILSRLLDVQKIAAESG
jgi:hypothetical protein